MRGEGWANRYRDGMNDQDALKILGILGNAGMEEAKAAYRSRAKRFHPDRSAGDEAMRLKAESRMKELNLAFRLVSDLLKTVEPVMETGSAAPWPSQSSAPPSSGSGSSATTGKGEESPAFKKHGTSTMNRMAAWCRRLFKSSGSSGGASPGSCTPKRAARSGSKNLKRDTLNNSFRGVFCKVLKEGRDPQVRMPGGPADGRKWSCPAGRRRFDYASYAVYKRRMNSRRSPGEISPGPVEPVQPVSRIKRVGH